MPTYEFLCTNCGEKEDIFLAMSKRNDEQKCKFCDNVLTRLIGKSMGFFLKGSGFYCNDYKKDKK